MFALGLVFVGVVIGYLIGDGKRKPKVSEEFVRPKPLELSMIPESLRKELIAELTEFDIEITHVIENEKHLGDYLVSIKIGDHEILDCDYISGFGDREPADK